MLGALLWANGSSCNLDNATHPLPLPAEYLPRLFFSGTLPHPDTAQGHIQELAIPFLSQHCGGTLIAYFYLKCVTQREGWQDWKGFAYMQDGKEVEHIWKKRLPVPSCSRQDDFRPILQNMDTDVEHQFHVQFGDSFEGPFTPLIITGSIPSTDSMFKFYAQNGSSFYSLVYPECPISTSSKPPVEYAVLHSYPPFFRDPDLLLHTLHSHMRYHMALGFTKYILNMYPKFIKALVARPYFRHMYDNGTLVFQVRHPLANTGEFFPHMFQVRLVQATATLTEASKQHLLLLLL